MKFNVLAACAAAMMFFVFGCGESPVTPKTTSVMPEFSVQSVNQAENKISVSFTDRLGNPKVAEVRWTNTDANTTHTVTTLSSEIGVIYTQAIDVTERPDGRRSSRVTVTGPNGSVFIGIHTDDVGTNLAVDATLIASPPQRLRTFFTSDELQDGNYMAALNRRVHEILGDAESSVLASPEANLASEVLSSDAVAAQMESQAKYLRGRLTPLYAENEEQARARRRMCTIANKAAMTCTFIWAWGGLPAITCIPGAGLSAVCLFMDLYDPTWKDPPPHS